MSNEIAVALIALFGTLAGSAGGVLASSRLTNFRLQKLEAKVEKHNSLIDRTYRLEEQMGRPGAARGTARRIRKETDICRGFYSFSPWP